MMKCKIFSTKERKEVKTYIKAADKGYKGSYAQFKLAPKGKFDMRVVAGNVRRRP